MIATSNIIEIIENEGQTFEQFNEESVSLLNMIDPSSLEGIDKNYYEYRKINVQRTNRILKTYNVSDELTDIISKIEKPQTWMIITEDWCGDSAQNLPYIFEMSEQSPNIKLKILLRDDNPEIMDQYLTNGGKSIPKLVSFDKEGNELFTWGPRPREAQTLVEEWRVDGLSKEKYNPKLHLWYGQNRGIELENEFIELLSS